MQRILVTGGDGLLAYALKKIVPTGTECFFLGHAEFDLTKPELMSQQLVTVRPDVVINTAAYNLVDRCEIERELSWAVNATGPEKLAKLCAEKNIRLVHYGTDYVFDGKKKSPYVESDPPNALNHYAAGKLAGEQSVLHASPKHLVMRTSWVFGWHPTQTKTFVHTILKAVREGRAMKATTDQASVPTYAPDLAQWTLELIQRGAAGLVHAVNDEGVSRFDWATIILDEAAQAGLIPTIPEVEAVTTAFFNSTMKRPDYTVMSNEKMAKLLGHPIRSWKPGLTNMLNKIRTASLQ